MCLSNAAAEASKPREIFILCEPTWIPGCSQNSGTDPLVCIYEVTLLST